MSAPFKLPLKIIGAAPCNIYSEGNGLVAICGSSEIAPLIVQAVNSYDRRTLLLQMVLAHLSDDFTTVGRKLFLKIEEELNGSET